jgi:NAD(P)-dependent dehydrogenase (short-subunit alcohol dehydrogenase family)
MSTRIATPFGFESTAAEVAQDVDLTGKRAVVTGGASGIGTETARVLAARGAEVTIAARNLEAADRVAAGIDGDVRTGLLDLADLDSVRAFAASWDGPLHLLVNNAGVMAVPALTLGHAGLEIQFATNHVGHFALTVGLHDALAAAEGARIVSLSSRGHLRSPVVFEDLSFERREYTPFGAYGQSKTANVLLAVGADDRWAAEGITANAVHPGGILDTNLSRHMEPEQVEALMSSGTFRPKTVEQGAATTMVAAVWPGLEGDGGHYFEDCNEAEEIHVAEGETPTHGVADYAVDHSNADRLWELSERLVAAG